MPSATIRPRVFVVTSPHGSLLVRSSEVQRRDRPTTDRPYSSTCWSFKLSLAIDLGLTQEARNRRRERRAEGCLRGQAAAQFRPLWLGAVDRRLDLVSRHVRVTLSQPLPQPIDAGGEFLQPLGRLGSTRLHNIHLRRA